MTYDLSGDLLSTTDPTGAVTTSTYDLDGRVLTTAKGTGTAAASTNVWSYDLRAGGNGCPSDGGAGVDCTAMADGLGQCRQVSTTHWISKSSQSLPSGGVTRPPTTVARQPSHRD
jgi:YD repeat-containing protein